MPDRYGEPRHGRDTEGDQPQIVDLDPPDQDQHPDQDQIDYRAAARRGTDTIRRQMGWK